MRPFRELWPLLWAAALCGCQLVLDKRASLGLCGDGVVQVEAGEECDDGNTAGGDGCSASCKKEVCGNGVLDVGEECDDGNLAAADGCSPTCRREVCGNGVLDPGEECDDGNLLAADGCSPSCRKEVCGNGELDPGEECDQGLANDNAGDCTLACRRARCGDGYVKTRGTPPYEICDDGNGVNGDGCNPECTLRGRLKVFSGTPGGKGLVDGNGGGARFAGIRGLAIEGSTLYIAEQDSCALRSMNLETGDVTTLGGRPGDCLLMRDGALAQATFSGDPKRLAVSGNELFVADGPELRKVDLAAGRVRTCFALPDAPIIEGLAVEGAPASALWLTSIGYLWRVGLPCSCELGAPDPCAAEIKAGQGSGTPLDGVGTSARFRDASSMTLDDSARKIYLVDYGTIRSFDIATRQVRTLAGHPGAGHADGVGVAAGIGGVVWGMVFDPVAKALYFIEDSGETPDETALNRMGWGDLRRFDPLTLEVRTVAGNVGPLPTGRAPETDGFGPFARFIQPWGLALWAREPSAPIVLVGEGAAVRAMATATGQVVTAAGSLINDLTHFEGRVMAAAPGFVYASNFTGQLLQLSVPLTRQPRSVPLCSTTGGYHRVEAVVADATTVYVADRWLDGICRIDLQGRLNAPPCCAGCVETCEAVFTTTDWEDWLVSGMAIADGKAYLTNTGMFGSPFMRVDLKTRAVTSLNVQTGYASDPQGIVAVGGALYATLLNGNQVLRIDSTSGATQVIGDGMPDSVDGASDKAELCHPAGIATDGVRLFVGETHCATKKGLAGHSIRQIDLATLQVTTLLGPGAAAWVVEGTGNAAAVDWPAGIAYEPTSGTLLVADSWANVVLQVD